MSRGYQVLKHPFLLLLAVHELPWVNVMEHHGKAKPRELHCDLLAGSSGADNQNSLKIELLHNGSPRGATTDRN